MSVLNHDVRFVPVQKDWHCSSILFELACRQPVMLEEHQSGPVGFDLALNCWLISNNLTVVQQRYQSMEKGEETGALFTSGALILAGTECLQNKSSQAGQLEAVLTPSAQTRIKMILLQSQLLIQSAAFLLRLHKCSWNFPQASAGWRSPPPQPHQHIHSAKSLQPILGTCF